MSSNRARLCFPAWVEESSVTRDLDLVARLAGSSLCRGLFVSTKDRARVTIEHARERPLMGI